MNKQSLDTVEEAVENINPRKTPVIAFNQSFICFSEEGTGISHNDETTPHRDGFKSTLGDILNNSG